MTSNLLESFERMALLLAAVLIAAAALFMAPHSAYSLTVGAALAALNAVMIHRIGRRIATSGKSPALLVVIFQLKLFFFVGLIYVAMRYLGVDTVPFACGISVLPAAVLTAGLFQKQLAPSTAPTTEESHG